ncbi:MAG: hypothetical protein FWD05_11400 [Oscillospiraceae bacterium]|nr:hypothetical protein [Oscillospiraceae bacterium]
MQKMNKYAQYLTQILAIAGAVLVGLSHIWNIPYATEIGQTIAVVIGVIGTCWLTENAYGYCKNKYLAHKNHKKQEVTTK